MIKFGHYRGRFGLSQPPLRPHHLLSTFFRQMTSPLSPFRSCTLALQANLGPIKDLLRDLSSSLWSEAGSRGCFLHSWSLWGSAVAFYVSRIFYYHLMQKSILLSSRQQQLSNSRKMLCFLWAPFLVKLNWRGALLCGGRRPHSFWPTTI